MKLPASHCGLEVQLMVDSTCALAADLTKIITLPADVFWDSKDSYRPSPNAAVQQYRFSRWAIRETALSLNELPATARLLMSRIQGLESNFLLLPVDSVVSLTIFVTESASVIGMGLDAVLLKSLARLNAGIEISLIFRTT